MRTLLLIGAAAAAYGTISVNFNACNSETTESDACTASLTGKTVIMHVEADFPPYNDVNSSTQQVYGFSMELFYEMCATPAFQNVGITCKTVRDIWSNAWSHHDSPGVGMMNQWYDLAFGFVTTARSQSFDYGYMVAYSPLTSVIKATNESVSTDGTGETIVLNCGWGYNTVVEQMYPNATILRDDNDNEEGCAVNTYEQIDRVMKGSASMALIPAGEAEMDDGSYYTVSNINMTESYPGVIQNGLGFFFNKKDDCLRAAANSALEALRTSVAFTNLCTKYGIDCYTMNLERLDILTE